MSRYCSCCEKSLKACICKWIECLPSEVELIILQHPSESKRPKGTAPILTLSLPSSRCFVGEDFSQHHELNLLLSQDGYSHYLLYPGELSQPVDALLAKQSQSSSDEQIKIRVILLDGTWKKAYKMWQLSSNLHQLPQIKLPENLQGNYRIRKAPSDNSLSTVEAGYHILSLLQPEQNYQPLLTAFEEMIQFQIDQMPQGVFQKNYLD